MSNKSTDFPHQVESTRNYLQYGFLGGPKVLSLRYVVDLYKGTTGLWVLFLMYYFNNYCSAMWVYLFLHGSYGMFWVIKDIFFPDSSFLPKITIGSVILGNAFLIFYWCIPLSIAMGYGVQQISTFRMCLVITMYILGLILMMGSDYQKTTTLKKRKGLISTGFFARTRNPNYLGEMLIYGSFAVCAGYWTSYAIIFFAWSTLFTTNMYLKDELSYKKKQGWDVYSKQSYILLPKLFPSDILNQVLFSGAMICIYYAYQNWNTILK